MDEILQITGVNKKYFIKKTELDVLLDINLDMREGEIISIVGSSGCGKSTLLKLIVGLERATSGSILIDGKEVTGPSEKCGIVYQEPRLFPWLTVDQNIAFGLSKNAPRSERKEKTSEYISLVGLNGFEHALPKQLSGGMQQRVSIARALVGNPEILLLDEPFGALDALTRIQMQNEIVRIWETRRTTMILVTHDIDESIFLSDKVIIMSKRPGKISKIINAKLPRPRDRSSPDFTSIRREIYQEFFQYSNIDMEYYI